MRDNVITATYNGTGRYKTQPLYQYDYGQKLVISGAQLPSAYEVHFANAIHGNATTQIGNADGVAIPDMYLLSGQTVYAWLFLHSGESDGETEFIITIPVMARAKPTDQQPTPVQQSAIDEAILALQQALYEAGVTVSHYPQIQNGYWYIWDVDDGEWVSTGVQAQGPAGADGQDGADGYSPTATVRKTTGAGGGKTYITITDKNGTTEAIIDDGKNGTNGQNGVSPTITSANITGGHRLTITDANGRTFVDVMDGDDGTSPIANVSKTGSTATITITDANGTTTAQVTDGTNGTNGTDGYSPTATVTKYGDTATITITDKNGTTTASVKDGTNGSNGSNGADGTTFTPSVASNGDLSWTNDGGKTNPSTVNIKGPQGDSGLSVDETVTGGTPSITAVSNHRYLCGTCSTLSFTPSNSGICEVIFTSGSTATVLTVPGTLLLPSWFDKTSLDANTIYDISVVDGIYGAVMTWA